MFKAPLGISGRVEGECSFPTTKGKGCYKKRFFTFTIQSSIRFM